MIDANADALGAKLHLLRRLLSGHVEYRFSAGRQFSRCLQE